MPLNDGDTTPKLALTMAIRIGAPSGRVWPRIGQLRETPPAGDDSSPWAERRGGCRVGNRDAMCVLAVEPG